MNRSIVKRPRAEPATSPAPQATTVATPTMPAPPAAANDDAAADSPGYVSNPLWIIAFGMAVFFVLVALVTAST